MDWGAGDATPRRNRREPLSSAAATEPAVMARAPAGFGRIDERGNRLTERVPHVGDAREVWVARVERLDSGPHTTVTQRKNTWETPVGPRRGKWAVGRIGRLRPS